MLMAPAACMSTAAQCRLLAALLLTLAIIIIIISTCCCCCRAVRHQLTSYFFLLQVDYLALYALTLSHGLISLLKCARLLKIKKKTITDCFN